jgi:hypothetical protein
METLNVSAAGEILSDFLPILLVVSCDRVCENQVLHLSPVAFCGAVLVLGRPDFVQIGVFLLSF